MSCFCFPCYSDFYPAVVMLSSASWRGDAGVCVLLWLDRFSIKTKLSIRNECNCGLVCVEVRISSVFSFYENLLISAAYSLLRPFHVTRLRAFWLLAYHHSMNSCSCAILLMHKCMLQNFLGTPFSSGTFYAFSATLGAYALAVIASFQVHFWPKVRSMSEKYENSTEVWTPLPTLPLERPDSMLMLHLDHPVMFTGVLFHSDLPPVIRLLQVTPVLHDMRFGITKGIGSALPVPLACMEFGGYYCFREEWFSKCLAQLKSEIIKANTLAQEAKYLAKELAKDTDYQVTLQIPVNNLTPNRKVNNLIICWFAQTQCAKQSWLTI